MNEMGYRNEDAVYALSEAGRLLKPRGGQVAVDPTAVMLLAYMAHNAYDWPPTEEMRRRHIPCRCYSRGWDVAARAFGMTIAGGEKAAQIIAEGGDLEAMMTARRTTARNRLSQTAKFLQAQGLIKLLVPADVRRERPATWLLLLGDERENREVEAWARECLGV
ncbi:hypothetical protein [Bifidobacterium sp. UTCIF-38]|uniref:hypothetical protein n=1 Tax=Bifidobacterium sp. UTCIF-38 TaxID=1465260 RepID=UPI001126E76F|nr:hypothetical protein [Bifidobacterium sp. UTCIF-38]TPF91239.1 hypothetical protein BW11_01030 [Bifidobacterium sp. UTCIF-38]